MELSCDYKLVQCWSGKTRYVCHVSTGSITQPRTQITKFIGKHIENQTNKNVNEIHIKDMMVHFFPRGVPNLFQGIVKLELRGCGLKEICRKDLQGLGSLRSVDLSHNKLRRLPDDLFIDTPQLEWISFENNLLVSFTSKLLDPIEDNRMEFVSFRNNPNIDIYYNMGRIIIGDDNSKYYGDYDEDLEDFQKIIECRVKRTLKKSKDHFDIFAEHWKTGSLTDVTLKSGQSEFKAHTFILSVYSPVFAEFFSSTEQNTRIPKVIIFDDPAAAVEEFLTFIYTGEVENSRK